MIRFAICDDNEIQVELTTTLLADYLASRSEETQIASFPDGKSLLADVRANGFYDIYILDMIMPDMNGMELATTLRMLNDEGKIIFLTSSQEYAVQSYDVQASHYLLKPVEAGKLTRVVGTLMNQMSQARSDEIEVKTASGIVVLRTRSIMTVVAENRMPIYKLTDGRSISGLMMRCKFHEEMSTLLSRPNFVECGVSRVVNLACVDMMDSESILLSDGSVVYPPQSAASTLMRQWLDYRRKR